jgi:hypothetical protein
MGIKFDPNHAAFQAKDALSQTEEVRLQIMRGAWMAWKKSGVKCSLLFLRPLALLALTAIGGCAQIEMYRLQGEVDELQEKLAYEKQWLKQANEQADSSANQSVKNQKNAKACKRRTKAGADSRSSNCVSGRKVENNRGFDGGKSLKT